MHVILHKESTSVTLDWNKRSSQLTDIVIINMVKAKACHIIELSHMISHVYGWHIVIFGCVSLRNSETKIVLGGCGWWWRCSYYPWRHGWYCAFCLKHWPIKHWYWMHELIFIIIVIMFILIQIKKKVNILLGVWKCNRISEFNQVSHFLIYFSG